MFPWDVELLRHYAIMKILENFQSIAGEMFPAEVPKSE